jgi:outer membrane protein assembly factor BamB
VRFAAGVALLVVTAPTVALAQPSDGWTQFQGGQMHLGADEQGPDPAFREAWTLDEPIGGPAGTSGLSPVAAGDGVAVTLAPEAVIAFEPQDGTQVWRIERVAGPPAPPAIVGAGDDALVVYPEGFGPNVPTDGGAGTDAPTTPSASPGSDAEDGETSDISLVAVALADGEERWRVALPSPTRGGVTAAGDGIYVGSNDGSVTAVDAATGEIRWTSEAVAASIPGPPAVADGLVVVSGAGDAERPFEIVALRDADGEIVWRYEPSATAAVGGPPSIANGLVYVGLEDRTVRAVSLVDGRERWVARLTWIVSPLASPAVAGDDVIVADLAGQVFALDGESGERRWDHALNVPVVRSSPVVSGDVVLIASADGGLFALDRTGGDLIWSADAADGVLRSLAVLGDRVVGVRAGDRPGLVAFEHDADGSLVRIASPTTVDPGRLAMNAAIAAVPIAVALLLLGRLLVGRLGPARVGQPMPRDPIEDRLADDGGGQDR